MLEGDRRKKKRAIIKSWVKTRAESYREKGIEIQDIEARKKRRELILKKIQLCTTDCAKQLQNQTMIDRR